MLFKSFVSLYLGTFQYQIQTKKHLEKYQNSNKSVRGRNVSIANSRYGHKAEVYKINYRRRGQIKPEKQQNL